MPRFSLRPHIVFFLLAPLALLVPLIWLDLTLFRGNTDAIFYANLLKTHALAAPSGSWMLDANAGTGSTAPLFTPPLAYALTALLTAPLSIAPVDMDTRLVAGMCLALAACGISAWLWLRPRFGHRAAVAGAAVFALSPYHLAHIYLHHNLAVLWALAAVPCMLAGAERAASGKKLGATLFGLAAALVACAHPLTLAVAAPMAALWCLWLGRKRRLATLGALSFSAILGAGLSAHYLLPALLNTGWLNRDAFLSGTYSAAGNLGHRDVTLMMFYLALALLAYFALRASRARVQLRMQPVFQFWLAMLALAFLLMLPFSAPLWQHVPGLRYLQFPAARLHVVMLAGGAWMAALAVRLAARNRFGAMAAAVPFYGVALVFIHQTYALPANLSVEYIREMRAYTLMPPPEYATRWSDLRAGTLYVRRAEWESTPQAELTKGRGDLTVTAWEKNTISLETRIASPTATIRLRQIYLPAWQALDDAGNMLELSPTGPEGLIGFSLPAGEQRIRLRFVMPGAHEGLIASMLATLAVMILVAKRGRPFHNGRI